MGLLRTLIDLYIWIVIIRVLLSWFDVDQRNQIVRFLIDATEPVLSKIRSVVPDLGGLDLSPLVLILILSLVRNMLH